MYAMTEDIISLHYDPGNVLYTVVAEKYKTTKSNVERNMRYAIEKAWSYGDVDIQNEIFGNTIDYNRTKPINIHAVTTLAQYCKKSIINIEELYSAIRIVSNSTADIYSLQLKMAENKSDNYRENIVIDLLKEIGFCTHYRGYNCIKDAVIMILKDESILGENANVLYYLIAKIYNTTPNSVRCQMSNVIKIAVTRGNHEVYKKIFGPTKNLERISNMELIYGLVHYLKKM